MKTEILRVTLYQKQIKKYATKTQFELNKMEYQPGNALCFYGWIQPKNFQIFPLCKTMSTFYPSLLAKSAQRFVKISFFVSSNTVR